MEVSGQLHGPSRFTPGTHFIGDCLGLKGGLDAVEYQKSVAPAANRIPAVQPVARRYTDCAIPAPVMASEGTGDSSLKTKQAASTHVCLHF
jgi:hypothetical protein